MPGERKHSPHSELTSILLLLFNIYKRYGCFTGVHALITREVVEGVPADHPEQ
jgi:hypothetical protein